MNTLTQFLATSSLALLASAIPSFAADSDPGYGPGAPGAGLHGASARSANRYAPQYFRPTQRFYGKGYTVTYRFVPWSDRMRGATPSTWDIEQYHLPTTTAGNSYAMGSMPRITYFYPKSGASPASPMSPGAAPVSSIATTPKPLPPIGEGPAKQ